MRRVAACSASKSLYISAIGEIDVSALIGVSGGSSDRTERFASNLNDAIAHRHAHSRRARPSSQAATAGTALAFPVDPARSNGSAHHHDRSEEQ
jgi:hypothetical protein